MEQQWGTDASSESWFCFILPGFRCLPGYSRCLLATDASCFSHAPVWQLALDLCLTCLRERVDREASALARQQPPRWGESFSRNVAHILSCPPPAATTHFLWRQAEVPNCPRRIQTEETVSRYNPLLHKNQSSSQFNSQIRSKLGHCFCCSASLSRLYAVLLRNQNLA